GRLHFAGQENDGGLGRPLFCQHFLVCLRLNQWFIAVYEEDPVHATTRFFLDPFLAGRMSVASSARARSMLTPGWRRPTVCKIGRRLFPVSLMASGTQRS